MEAACSRIGVFDVVGTTASGWLSDRYDPRELLVEYYALRGLSLLALPLAFDAAQAALLAFVVVFGLDRVATVPPTSTLATSTFGAQRGRRLRLDLLGAPARRSDRGVGRRARPHRDGRPHARVPRRRGARGARRGGGAADPLAPAGTRAVVGAGFRARGSGA